jgi:hypothetical protein
MGVAPTSAPSPAAMSAMVSNLSHAQVSISAEALHRGLAADLVRAEMVGRRRKRPLVEASDKGKASSKGSSKKAKAAAKAASTPTSTTMNASTAMGLRGTEARDLAGAMIRALRPGFALPPLPVNPAAGSGTPTINDASPTGNVTGISLAASNDPSEATFRTFCAAYLGIPAPNTSNQGQSSVQGPSATKRIAVRRYRIDEQGYEDPVHEDETDGSDNEEPPAAENTGRRKSKTQVSVSTPVGNKNKKKVKETFDIEWEVNIGGLVGKFAMKGLVLDSVSPLGGLAPESDGDVRMDDADVDINQDPSDGLDLERRVKRLEDILRRRNEELRVLKEAVLDVALKT